MNSMFLIAVGCVALLVIASLVIPGRKPKQEMPVGHSKPAADEPTPDKSATATPAQVRAAKKHVPPA